MEFEDIVSLISAGVALTDNQFRFFVRGSRELLIDEPDAAANLRELQRSAVVVRARTVRATPGSQAAVVRAQAPRVPLRPLVTGPQRFPRAERLTKSQLEKVLTRRGAPAA